MGDTLEAALWCVYQAADSREIVLSTVNLGIDSDTIAAITGDLAVVLYSAERIPKEWVEETLKVEMITALCDEFGRGIKE